MCCTVDARRALQHRAAWGEAGRLGTSQTAVKCTARAKRGAEAITGQGRVAATKKGTSSGTGYNLYNLIAAVSCLLLTNL